MQKSISPPSKSILFNRNLHYNDGLLIGHISRSAGIGYKDAEANVVKYAEKITKSLESGNNFTIDELGFFFQDKQKNLQFQPELSINFLLESYGLTNVYFREMYQAIGQGIKSSRYVTTGMSVINRRKRIRRLVYTGIAASLLAAMILIPIKTGYLGYSGLQPFKERSATEDVVPGEKEFSIQQGEINDSPWTGIKEIIPSEYHIITGSFREFGNARQLMVRMIGEGYNARILSAEGDNFRVSAVSFSDKQEAHRALVELRKHPGMSTAWILKY